MRTRTILLVGIALAILFAVIGYLLARKSAQPPAQHRNHAYLTAIQPPSDLTLDPRTEATDDRPAFRRTRQPEREPHPRIDLPTPTRDEATERGLGPQTTSPDLTPSTTSADSTPVEPPIRATSGQATSRPAAAPETEGTEPPQKALPTYRIGAGDTLASIAVMHYGDASKWRLIARANPTVNPKQLQIGQVVTLPPAGSEVPGPDPLPQSKVLATHTVAKGDSLYSLARHYYGNGARWPAIREANPGLRGASLHELKLGSKLVIPVITADGD